MVIQHNLMAMNAERQYNLTGLNLKKSAERLSSGYRINRAADNAAGLAISEKMRRQIRGLTQASANCQDGISMVQTAEGALGEVHDMLHRLNELCVQAANGTLTYDDRSDIQAEIYDITDEIDRVGTATTFNTLKLLNGLPQFKTEAVTGGITVNGSTGVVTQATENTKAFYQISPLRNGDVIHYPSPDDRYEMIATRDEIDRYNRDWADYRTAKNKYDTVELPAYQAELEAYEQDMADYEADKAAWDADNSLFDGIEPVPPQIPTEPQEPVKPLERDGSSPEKAKLCEFDKAYNDIAGDILIRNLNANADVAETASVSYRRDINDGRFTLSFYGPLPINLQVGSESGDVLSFKIGAVNAGSLGVSNLYVKDDDGSDAGKCIALIKRAIEKNSSERSKLGAVQNRLEHTINNLENVIENTTAAESRIRDTDMASEMVKFSASNILSQAGQAILAQANQSNQGVLSLLG